MDLRLAADGDGDAFARIIRRYQDQVASWMWRFTQDRQQLEELVQDVFVQAYFSLPRYRESNVFEGWLHRIATRVGYQYWKRKRREADRRQTDLQEWDGAASDDSQLEQSRVRNVQDALGRLPPRDRLVLMLRYLEERSVAETATLTGWSQAMVKIQSFRARTKLRRLLEEAWPDREQVS
ncbi:MAG: RNA polymerase sigma factor [Phycisphaerae bacterium]|nr:RNA polymerase sigma factor [Phycisphaerae bacterium]